MTEDVEQIQNVMNDNVQASHVADAWLLSIQHAQERGMIDKDTADALVVNSAIILNHIIAEQDAVASKAIDEGFKGIRIKDQAKYEKIVDEAADRLIETGMLVPKVEH